MGGNEVLKVEAGSRTTGVQVLHPQPFAADLDERIIRRFVGATEVQRDMVQTLWVYPSTAIYDGSRK